MLATTSVYADIGSVTELTGAATIKRGKETVTVSKGTKIETNDKVETKNGKVKITFKDDTTVSVSEHSSLVIDDFVFDPSNAKGGKLGLKATSGAVRYVSGAIAHNNPNSVKINTPTAAIAVRGTDFVMGVNEVGSSMIILMPSCDWESSAVKGMSCSTGAIDVESGPNRVALNRPYQATLVESTGQPPSPPITVNLFNTPIGTNLLVTPPQTMSGAPVVAAARAAAASTGVPGVIKKDDSKKEDKDKDSKDDAKDPAGQEQVASNQQAENKKANDKEATETKTEIVASNKEEASNTSQNSAAVTETKQGDPDWLRRVYKDKAQTQQVAWAIESVSQNGRNVAQIIQTITSQVQVTVTQDSMTIGQNFSSGKPAGTITINQSYR